MGQNRGLPLHLDTGPEDFEYQFPLEGEVSAVYTKDNAQNLTGGKYTTYQIKAFFPNTYTAVLNSQMRYMGQGGNGANAQEDPLLVGQRVVIAFLGGHPDRPFIIGTLPDSLTDNAVSQTEAQHPRYKKITNGLDVEVDKDGKASVKLVSGQQVEIQDSSGAGVAVIKEDGTIRGNTGVNHLSGRYETTHDDVGKGSLCFLGVSCTERGREERYMRQEDQFLQSLRNVRYFKVAGTTLELHLFQAGPAMRLVLKED